MHAAYVLWAKNFMAISPLQSAGLTQQFSQEVIADLLVQWMFNITILNAGRPDFFYKL